MLAPQDLKDLLLKSGFVSPKDFDQVTKTSKEIGKPVTEILIYQGLISEELLNQLIAEHYQVPFIKLSRKTIAPEILALIPEEAANTFHIIPIDQKESILEVAMEDPADLEAKEFIKRKTGLKVKYFYSPPQEIAQAIGQYKKNITEAFKQIIEENVSKSAATHTDIQAAATDIPVVNILDTILEYAVAERSSDVHMEAAESSLLVRYRIDGILRDTLSLPKSIHPALIARIKILSDLKIDEHRIPQDGRFKFKIKDSYIALRVSILPSFYGENIVLRILPESARPMALEELGITGKNLELVKSNIRKPHGMILVTGPTGSGKTTTLYSVLTLLNTTEVKICTIEDPVEYSIKRINQTQINPQAGLSFAAGLRALLRHDPDIIMVGEIRDKETAEMAIHSALTGHLVLSTLHTNDAASTIPRFLDMGAEGFLVASTVNLVIAQRLVRKICPSCIQPYTLDIETQTYLKSVMPQSSISTKFYRSTGCQECNHKGYKGRIGIYEILNVTPEIRNLVVKRVPSEQINSQALKEGMTPLILDGINKAASGITSIEEVLRVVRE